MEIEKLIECLTILKRLGESSDRVATRPTNHGMAIVVLDRGFVYLGKVTTDGDWCLIEDAKNIRAWGTTKGLGQLAIEGPTSNTKIDPVGTVKAPMRALIAIIPTKEEKWNKS